MIQEIRKLPKLPNVMKQKYSLFLYIQSKGKIFKAGGYIKLLQSVDCKSQGFDHLQGAQPDKLGKKLLYFIC